MIGYIQKTENKVLTSLLDADIKLDVKVRHFNKEKPTWERLWVGVWQRGAVT